MIEAKVVHIITMMELGGAQQNTLFTVQHLNPDRFAAYLISGYGGELFDEAAGLQRHFPAPDLIRAVRPGRDLRAFFQIRNILKRIKAQEPAGAPLIVHTHSSKAGIIGRWAAQSVGIKNIIHSIHGFGFHDYQPWWLKYFYVFIEKISAPITTRFIAVSKANIAVGERLNIFAADRVRLIRSGIDIDLFSNAVDSGTDVRTAFGVPARAPLVTMVSCLKPQKNPLAFVRVCEHVAKFNLEAHFMLVGDGVLRCDVEEAVQRCGLQGRFHLAGWRRDIPDILAGTQVLVLTSLWEGLPRVLPQAMAASVPAVATRVDGSPEAIRDGENGFLVQPDDDISMADKIVWLLQHPEKAREMGAQGSALVAEFDINKMVSDQEELYSSLLSP